LGVVESGGHAPLSDCDGEEFGAPKSNPVVVLLLIRSLAFGGAQRQLVELARSLKERGHRVAVGTFYRGGPLLADLEQAEVPVIDLNKGGRWETLGFLLRLRRVIKNMRPDVVYSFVGSANIFAALIHRFVARTKLVWSIRASDMDLEHYDWAHRLAYGIECRLSRVPDLIVSNSNAGMEFAAAHNFPRQRIAIVPNGIDTIRFDSDSSLREAQRKAWGISDREIAVGMLARLDPMKGYSDFLRAATKVVQSRFDVKFICIGDGREEGRLKQLAAELGISRKVLFVGATNDPVAALNGLDLFCSASVWGEGFSNAIAEAMACRLRCVVTDVGDSPIIVGDCGITVPRSNPELLADAIVRQLTTLDEGEFSRGRERVVEKFSVAAMVARTVALFQQLLT
jgi:glycosyltransferase involved in cell wall biosynthesis